MNHLNFNQTGGFGLSTNILDALQSSLALLGGLGEMAGDKTILKGCELVGANVTDGIVYLNGEAFVFKGGTPLISVKIYETATQKIFENGDVKDVIFERWVGFGTGTGAIPWSDFVKVDTLRNLKSRILPAGTNPQLYSGSVTQIPSGWQLCDGTNGTPNLKGRFIVGYDSSDYDYNTIGKTGGEKKHTLTEAELPAHDHDLTNTVYSNESGGINAGDKLSHDGNIYAREVTKTNNAGSGQSHENRPPYYTLAYIIYTGN